MTFGRVYVDEITPWGQAATVVLVAMLPFGFLGPVLPLPTDVLASAGLAWFGLVFLLFGIDRAAIERSDGEDAGDSSAHAGDEQEDGTASITISAMLLAMGLSLGGVSLLALAAIVAVSP
jgi:hypothetical protein